MKTFLFILFTTLVQGPFVFANSPTQIYGWDIHCIGKNGEKVVATQEDDDFVIHYSGLPSAFSSQGSGTSYANLSASFDSSVRALDFKSDPDQGSEPEVSLSVYREKPAQETRAKGYFQLGEHKIPVRCWARYGKSEDEFQLIRERAVPTLK